MSQEKQNSTLVRKPSLDLRYSDFDLFWFYFELICFKKWHLMTIFYFKKVSVSLKGVKFLYDNNFATNAFCTNYRQYWSMKVLHWSILKLQLKESDFHSTKNIPNQNQNKTNRIWENLNWNLCTNYSRFGFNLFKKSRTIFSIFSHVIEDFSWIF